MDMDPSRRQAFNEAESPSNFRGRRVSAVEIGMFLGGIGILSLWLTGVISGLIALAITGFLLLMCALLAIFSACASAVWLLGEINQSVAKLRDEVRRGGGLR